jgi:hypothetical protein
MVNCGEVVVKAERLSLCRNASRNSLDFGGRATAQISDGPMFDFAVVAKRLAQQIARVGLSP